MRLLAATVAAAVALLAWAVWATTRDLREPWQPFPEDDTDWIQPADPVTVHGPYVVPTPDWLTPPWRVTNVPNGTGDVIPRPWVNTNYTRPLGGT